MMCKKLFEAVRSIDNRTMMSTNQDSCVPYEYLKSMKEAGYRFKVAGKFVNIQDLKKAIKLALSQGVGELGGNNFVDEDATLESEDIIVMGVDLAKGEDKVFAVTEVKSVPAKSKEVRCLETGKVYKNQSEAAKDLKIDPAQVSDSIKTGRKRSGYTFERVNK